jgi:hypothetical protein
MRKRLASNPVIITVETSATSRTTIKSSLSLLLIREVRTVQILGLSHPNRTQGHRPRE